MRIAGRATSIGDDGEMNAIELEWLQSERQIQK
jgi:hypothetical protein